LAAPHAAVEVLRASVNLALASETEGIARASRVRRLAERWLERIPGDAGALLVLARALLALGEGTLARTRLDAIERSAPASPAAAEALALRLEIDDPGAEAEVRSVLRAASSATGDRLGDVAARARRLGVAHGSWPAWLAAATAERRLGRCAAARRALDAALEIAPGAPAVHSELAALLIEQGAGAAAAEHAQKALRLEGPSPVGLRLLARALAAGGRLDEAVDAAGRAVALRPEDRESEALLRALRGRLGRRDWRAAAQRALWGLFSR
ncbi:MAG: tetratricopeptide repeat protein, partial [Polyangiaceae bacterium]|nr:tetratricopeptide repeat protein [Polyangiaceae bacterium]